VCSAHARESTVAYARKKTLLYVRIYVARGFVFWACWAQEQRTWVATRAPFLVKEQAQESRRMDASSPPSYGQTGRGLHMHAQYISFTNSGLVPYRRLSTSTTLAFNNASTSKTGWISPSFPPCLVCLFSFYFSLCLQWLVDEFCGALFLLTQTEFRGWHFLQCIYLFLLFVWTNVLS
jgi:hypothetical protein